MNESPRRGGWSPVSLSILLHGAIALLAIGAYMFVRKPPPREVRLALDGTVVRSAPRPAPRQPVEAAPVATPPPAPEKVEDQAAKREAEKQEKREAEQRVAREQAAELAAKKEAEEKAAQQKAAQDKAAKEKAARDKAASEKAAQEKLAREKAQADQQRVQREAELNAQIAAEERVAAARASGQMAQYVAQITAKIERNWIRPPSAQPGLNCEVRVTQVPGGAVVGVQVGRCNGDESVRQSIEAAVYRASPLPMPSDPALFDRNLVVTFRPES